MKTWTYTMLIVWILVVVAVALPNHELTDNFSYDSTVGDQFLMETDAKVNLQSDKFFAVETEAKLAADMVEAEYQLEVLVPAGESLKVIKGSPKTTITPEDGNYVELYALMSVGDFFISTFLMTMMCVLLWYVGALVIEELS